MGLIYCAKCNKMYSRCICPWCFVSSLSQLTVPGIATYRKTFSLDTCFEQRIHDKISCPVKTFQADLNQSQKSYQRKTNFPAAQEWPRTILK